MHTEFYAFAILKADKDVEKISCCWIALWTEHLVKSFDVEVGLSGDLAETYCRVDVVPKQFFS